MSEADLLLFSRSRLTAPRTFRGQMCGIHVPRIPPIPGGASDPSLVLSWFIDRYSSSERQQIYGVYRQRYIDLQVSWPDSREMGSSISEFLDFTQEISGQGLLPCVFLGSKDYDDPTTFATTALPVVEGLIEVGICTRICIAWEANLWLSPTQLQQAIDLLAPPFIAAGGKVYVHFSSWVFAWQPDKRPDGSNGSTSDFWNANVGKLTGILHQSDTLGGDRALYQAKIQDCLARFSGEDGFVTDCGAGHPFDFIGDEISAQHQFDGTMSESDGDDWGRWMLNTPAVNGVAPMGSGNGQ